MRKRIEPSSDGAIWLTRWEVAWLARVTTQTIRKWVEDGLLSEDSAHRVSWTALSDCAQGLRHSIAHWTWLNADLSQSQLIGSGLSIDETARLHDEIAVLRTNLAAAVADAENLDQAVMSYRDNWKRRTLPQTPGDITR